MGDSKFRETETITRPLNYSNYVLEKNQPEQHPNSEQFFIKSSGRSVSIQRSRLSFFILHLFRKANFRSNEILHWIEFQSNPIIKLEKNSNSYNFEDNYFRSTRERSVRSAETLALRNAFRSISISFPVSEISSREEKKTWLNSIKIRKNFEPV